MFANIIDIFKNFSFETDFSLYSFILLSILFVVNVVFLYLVSVINPNKLLEKDFDEKYIPCDNRTSVTPIFYKLHISDISVSSELLCTNHKASDFEQSYEYRETDGKTLNFIQRYGYVATSLTEAYSNLYKLKDLYNNFLPTIFAVICYNLSVLHLIYMRSGFWFCVIYTAISVLAALFLRNTDMVFHFLNSDDRETRNWVLSYSEDHAFKVLSAESEADTSRKLPFSRKSEVILELMNNRLACINYSIKECLIRRRIFYISIPCIVLLSLFFFKIS